MWIDNKATIMSGVTVGDGARIGIGAIVTHDVAPYEIVAGVPAHTIRTRFDAETVALLEQLRWWDLPEAETRAAMPILMGGQHRGTARTGGPGERPTFPRVKQACPGEPGLPPPPSQETGKDCHEGP